MSNLTDALIAAKLVGGSGGSGGGSGLPEITTETVTVVEEQTVTGFQNAGGIYLGVGGSVSFASVSTGDSVDVIFDGITYHTSVKEIQGLVAIGNSGLTGAGEDTGEPFILMDSYPSAPGNLTVLTNKTGTSHTVGASGSASTPPNGSILIVQDGEWQTEKFDSLGIFALAMIVVSDSFTIPANMGYDAVDIPMSTIVGVPSSWKTGVTTGVTLAYTADQEETDVLLTLAKIDFVNQTISSMRLYNPTASDVTFNGVSFKALIVKSS